MLEFLPAQTDQPDVLRRRSFDRLLGWDRELPHDLVQQLWDDPQSLMEAGKILQEKPRCVVVRVDHRAGQFVLKHHSWGGIGRTLKKSLRRSSAQKAFFDTRFLRAAGIRTPCAWAFGEGRFGPFSSNSFLLTEYVEGTTLYRQMRFNPPSIEVIHDLARQVAALWQQLDDLSVSHNDFKTENLQLHPDGQLWLIDLELMRRCRRWENCDRSNAATRPIFCILVIGARTGARRNISATNFANSGRDGSRRRNAHGCASAFAASCA